MCSANALFIFLLFIEDLCSLKRSKRVRAVLPIYFSLHILHLNSYMMLTELQYFLWLSWAQISQLQLSLFLCGWFTELTSLGPDFDIMLSGNSYFLASCLILVFVLLFMKGRASATALGRSFLGLQVWVTAFCLAALISLLWYPASIKPCDKVWDASSNALEDEQWVNALLNDVTKLFHLVVGWCWAVFSIVRPEWIFLRYHW